jgi:hypothetical protein
VIEQWQVKQDTDFFEFTGKFFVCLTGIKVARGMIVSHNEGGSIAFEGNLKYNFRVCYCTRLAALRNPEVRTDFIAAVEQEHIERLPIIEAFLPYGFKNGSSITGTVNEAGSIFEQDAFAVVSNLNFVEIVGDFVFHGEKCLGYSCR